MNADQPAPKSLIGKCLRQSRGKYRTEYLRGHAAVVVVAARIVGPRSAGKTLGIEFFGEPLSPTPILTIVAAVECDEIHLTEEDLRAVVMQDEGATQFLQSNPWLIDPTGKSAPPKRRGRKPKSAAAEPTPTQKGMDRTPDAEPTPPKSRDTAKRATETHRKQNPSPEYWAALSKEHEEDGKRPPQKPKPKPEPPVFRCPQAPPRSASEEEHVAWIQEKCKALADYIQHALALGWEISPDWDGYNPLKNHARYIGQPSTE